MHQTRTKSIWGIATPPTNAPDSSIRPCPSGDARPTAHPASTWSPCSAKKWSTTPKVPNLWASNSLTAPSPSPLTREKCRNSRGRFTNRPYDSRKYPPAEAGALRCWPFKEVRPAKQPSPHVQQNVAPPTSSPGRRKNHRARRTQKSVFPSPWGEVDRAARFHQRARDGAPRSAGCGSEGSFARRTRPYFKPRTQATSQASVRQAHWPDARPQLPFRPSGESPALHKGCHKPYDRRWRRC